MQKKLLLSICCLTYNHGGFIREALEGMLMQKTNFGIEILIHDDASTDDTADIIREFEAKHPEIIKPIYQTENQYSKGIRLMSGRFNFPRAKGKYIAMCEGDDYWTDPLKLQKQVDFLEANPSYILSFHNAIKIGQAGNHLSNAYIPKEKQRDYSPVELSHGPHILLLTCCFRNIKIPIIENIVNGDTFIYSYLGTKGAAKYDDTIQYAAHRFHSGGVWSMQRQEVKFKNFIKTYKAIANYYKSVDNSALYEYFKEKQQQSSEHLIRHEITEGKYDQAKDYSNTLELSESRLESISPLVALFDKPKIKFVFGLIQNMNLFKDIHYKVKVKMLLNKLLPALYKRVFN